VRNSHSLNWLWSEAKKQCNVKLDAGYWNSIDVVHVDACIAEFEAIDPKGDRLRYPVPQFKVNSQSAQEVLGIDYSALLFNMEHVRDVLDRVDTYLVESHGDNSDWEAEMNSW
jgi:hypothetical protein